MGRVSHNLDLHLSILCLNAFSIKKESDGFMMLAVVAKLLSHTLKQSYVVFTALRAEM